MQLKSLEIQGFKSFPDKTRLEFGRGFTAVVGPNGSGKSNLSDAMRWVMGEQSVKTLRGGNRMEDVIFGGTQNRKPHGFAQVSLTIDNSDHRLDVDAPEVTVTRKLYRSGESEYRINNVSVRLKDIYELFMDTGLGRDGYSIIGQGRIAEIVSAKSTQRREIFEEAAGISKYRYRKEEAEKRLNQAQENLVRLKDILLELEGRVEPLRIQSEKAARFLELSKVRRELEISLWMRTVERSRELLRENDDHMALCKADHDEIQQKLSQIEAAVEQAYADMQRCLVEMDENRARARELDEQAAQAQERRAVLQNDMEHNNRSIEQMRLEMEQAGQSAGALQEQLDANAAQQQAQRREADELTREQGELSARLAGVNASQNEQMAAQRALQEQLAAVNDALSKARVSSAASSSMIGQTSERIRDIEEANRRHDYNIGKLQEEAAACRELIGHLQDETQALQNSLNGYRLKAQSRQKRLDGLNAQQNEYRAKAESCEQRARLLSDMEKNMEGFGSSVKFIMRQATSGALRGVHGAVSSLISTEEQYATAIEIALGAAMQNIVVENDSVAKQAIGLLKNAKEGRATFLPLSAIHGRELEEPGLEALEGVVGLASRLVRAEERYRNIVCSLLGRIVIAEDLDYATAIAKRYHYRFRIVTLDGQVVNAGGSMTGGYTARSAGVLTRRHEIEALTAKAAQERGRADALVEEIKAASEELAALSASMLGLESRIKTAGEERVEQSAELRRLERTLEEAQQARAEAQKQYDEMTARLEQLRAQGGNSREAEEKMVALAGELSQRLDEMAAQLEHAAGSAGALGDALQQNRMALFAAQKELQVLQEAQLRLQEQAEGQGRQREALESRIGEAGLENRRIAQEIERLAAGKVEWEQASRALSARNEALAGQRNGYEQRQNQLRGEERILMEQREQAGRELARLEERKNTLQSEYDGIVAKLWDEYELTLSQAAECAQPVEDDLAAQKELTAVRNRIRALGSINVEAIEEYKEVSERYRFLKEQIDDVEHSREELLRMIRELTGQMVELFDENFKAINKHFGRIFAELFGGGRAELILENPDDLLNSGIEIFVQPPGKIIKNLSALSGGEQAFVAICIYFAILHVKPSPFCLLDEIEAALDDVNVTKYAQYLRKLTAHTQFIVITHRRGTMEEADVLYGVTMQEEGVSKMLQLKVSEIESKLGIKNR